MHAGRKAFTLIELVVVLTVLAVAAGLIVPRIGESISRQELHEAAQHLAWTARTAREVAIARGQPVVLQLDLDNGGYFVARRNSTGELQPLRASWLKPARWAESVKAVEMRLPDGTVARGGLQQVSFNGDGTSSGAAIRLVSGDREQLVVVRPGNGRAVAGDPRSIGAADDVQDFGD